MTVASPSSWRSDRAVREATIFTKFKQTTRIADPSSVGIVRHGGGGYVIFVLHHQGNKCVLFSLLLAISTSISEIDLDNMFFAASSVIIVIIVWQY